MTFSIFTRLVLPCNYMDVDKTQSGTNRRLTSKRESQFTRETEGGLCVWSHCTGTTLPAVLVIFFSCMTPPPPAKIILHNPRKPHLRKRLQTRTQIGSWWCMNITPILPFARQEYPGHLDERDLDSSAVFQHFYVIIPRCRAGPNCVLRTQRCGLRVEHGRAGRSLGPTGAHDNVQVAGTCGPPTPHRVESSQGAGVGFISGGATHTAGCKIPSGLLQDCCSTAENYGVAQQYHRAACSVNWL
jgi:hypothetical protein